MERALTARLIVSTGYDYEWKDSNLVLAPGELAISIPTKQVTIDNELVITKDESKDILLKIGDNDHFYTKNTDDTYSVNGTAGILTIFADTGIVETNERSALKIVKNNSGESVIQLTQAHIDDETEEGVAGILSGQDYKDLDIILNILRSSDEQGNSYIDVDNVQQVLTKGISVAEVSDGVYEAQYEEETIYWNCGNSVDTRPNA